MEVANVTLLDEFATKHDQARRPLKRWLAVVQQSTWTNHAELKATFPSADYTNGRYVFNIKGNDFRLIAVVVFTGETVIVDGVYTHDEYSKLQL